MNGDQPRVKRHLLFDHKLATVFGTQLLFLILSVVILVPLRIFLYIESGSTTEQLLSSLVSICAALVLQLVFWLRFRRQFDGALGWSRESLMLALPALLLVVINFMDIGDTFNNPLYALVMALAPGISEEVAFRSIPVANWMCLDGDENALLPCTLVTSLYFGCFHAFNSLVGAPLSTTVFQVFYATCLAVLFAAVFLRTGSIMGPIVLHTLIDLTSFLFMDMAAGGVITEELTYGLPFFFTVAASFVILVAGVYLLRPAKRPEIVALWESKWHKHVLQ